MRTKRALDLEDIDELIGDVNLPEGWVDILVKAPDLPMLLAHIAHEGRISHKQIKRSKYSLPSFSRATREDVSKELQLPVSPKSLNFPEEFAPPACFLPPSLLEEMF